jgi:hypothetical protein
MDVTADDAWERMPWWTLTFPDLCARTGAAGFFQREFRRNTTIYCGRACADAGAAGFAGLFSDQTSA